MPLGVGALLISILIACPLFFIALEVKKEPSDGWKQLSQKDADTLIDPEVIAMLPPELQAEYLPKELTPWQKLIDSVFYKDFHATTLYERTKTTLLLLGCVLSLSLLIGTTLAWVLSMWHVPGKGLITFLLALPLAFPTYVMATSYKLITSDVQIAWSIKIRERHGAEAMKDLDQYWNFILTVFVLTLCFYPYVFLAARSAFSSLSAHFIETSKSLGSGIFRTYRRVILPLARPAIVGGVMLVAMETLNEYGAMKILGVETLLTEIFRIRSGVNDLNTAVRVAACIMVIVFVLLLLEQLLRGRKKFHSSKSAAQEDKAKKASPFVLGVVYTMSGVVFSFSFLVPLIELLRQANLGLKRADVLDFMAPIWDSLTLALQAMFFILFISLMIAYAHRRIPRTYILMLNKISSLGYAIPGAILGVALITWTGGMLQSDSMYPVIQKIFYQSAYGLVIAYVIRFLVVGFNPIDAGFRSISQHIDESSHQLGKGKWKTILRVHIPMLRPSILAACLVIFVDVLKELPLTLIMSPFNTETLAMQTYSLFAVQEEFAVGAIPSLILIFSGVGGMFVVKCLLNHRKEVA